MAFTKFKPHTCEGCGQTTTYALALDRGSALIVLAIYNAVRKKGTNLVHILDEMVVDPAEYGGKYQAMIEDGKMSVRMEGNISRPRFHGLIAQGKEAGWYLITPKGAKFLRGEKVPRVAIIDKRTHTKKEYLDPERDQATFGSLLKRETPFWQITNFEIDEVTGTFRSVPPTPQAALL